MPSAFRKIWSRRGLSAVFRERVSVATATLAFVLAVCVAIVGLEASRLLELRAEALADGRTDTANLVRSLTQHAELTFRAADAVLTGLVEQLERGDFSGEEGRDRLAGWFEREVDQISQFQGFAVVDERGMLIVSSRRQRTFADKSDREYFLYHRDSQDRGLHVSAPVQGRNSEEWVIPVSRRIDKGDGSFGGVALALIRTSYFQSLYDELDIGKEGAILLASADGRLLVRRPFAEDNVGKDLRQSGVFQQLQRSKEGSSEIKSSVDGVVRLNSYQKSDSYGLLVAVAKNSDEILAPWHERARFEVLETALVLLIVASLGFFVRRMAGRLAALNGLFELALSNMPNGLCMFDADQRLVISNERYRKMYGLREREVKPGTPLRAILETHLANGETSELDVDGYIEACLQRSTQEQLMQDGRTIFIRRKAIAGGGWIATHEDITELKRNRDLLVENASALQNINARFEAAINNMSQGVCLYDTERRIVVSNRRYAEIYHLSYDQVKPGTSLSEVQEHRLRQGTHMIVAPDSQFKQNIDSEVHELADGRVVSISRHVMRDGGWLTTHEDITDRARSEQKIAYLAQHDLLTGLPNRTFFTQMLEGPVRGRDNATADAFAVFMLDLDKFKQVNDTLGHAAGDQLLVEVARRLKAAIRDTDVLARFGGDEFAIIQSLGSDEHEGAIALALRIIDAVAEPFDLGGYQSSVGTSIGIAFAPQDGRDPKDLLQKADLALYAAKSEGRNDFRLFKPDMMRVADSQKAIENDLRRAIAKAEFELHYQPIIDVRTQTICGAEALVRWRHPQRGLVYPDQFIGVAEASGLILPLGDWILQQACKDAASWPASLKVAVNLSAVQFNKGNLFDVVVCALVETGLGPERLELEITESALLDKQAAHLQTVRQLKNLGISIALDDFGTGYSSASYVTKFPIDRIKIDKSFTQGSSDRRDCAAVIASILALARGLDIAITAEGVETEQQFQMLRNSGVECAQGYLFGRPVPLSVFLAENFSRTGQARAAS
jgi:diguanylate cyclase (GGDEF)-like protein